MTPAAQTLPPAQPPSFEAFWAEHYAERFAAAEAQERQWQDEAFVDQPHRVCGFDLRGMTPYDLLLLHGCGNPFAVGGTITAEAIAQFVAVLVVEPPRGWWSRRQFFRRLAAYPYAASVAEIEAYLRRMFCAADIAFAPNTRHQPVGDDAERQADAQEVSTCFLAPLVMHLACETGWREADILGMRLDKLFQYRRALAVRNGVGQALSSSSKLIAEALADYNERQRPAA